MIVKCPQCATGYSIPENLIGEKPKKMRCSRCKNVFALTRRHDKAPSGYEEFTGAQHLPQEFAFLKASEPEQAAPPAPQAAPAAEPAPDAEMEIDPEAEGAVPEPIAPAAPPVSAGYYAGRQGPPPTQEAWEEEVPLELSAYSIPVETHSRGAQAFGKFVFVLLVLGIAFFGFVMYRNDWSISIDDLGGQIGDAFSGEKREKIPDEARSLDVVVAARTLVDGSAGKILIVTGEVFNRGFTGAARIMLRGRILAGAREVKAEVRAPCGKIVDDEAIRLTPKGAMSGHFRSKTGELYNCVISVDGSAPFQLVFDDVPPEYGSSATLEVSAVSAQLAE